jgi:hypothetical protein
MAVYVKNGEPVTIQWALDRSDISENGCWIWNGALMRGYGSTSLCSIRQGAHRTAWEIANDQRIPEGMEVHHTCYTIACVNPEHLEIVTGTHNKAMRRPGWRRASTRCQRGHEMVGANVKVRPNGKRECATCVRGHGQKYYRNKVANGWTPTDNRPRKGVQPKLTPAQVAEIARRRAAGERNKDLAREFGVSPSTITDIATGRRAARAAVATPSPRPVGRPMSVDELRRALTPSRGWGTSTRVPGRIG